MQHILPILMRYRYLILASLSLLLISEMVVVDIDFVPVEYEWVFRCLVALTMVAWTGILCVIGYGPPIDRAVVKRTPNIYVPDSSVVDALEDEPKFTQEYLRAMYPSVIDALEERTEAPRPYYIGSFTGSIRNVRPLVHLGCESISSAISS